MLLPFDVKSVRAQNHRELRWGNRRASSERPSAIGSDLTSDAEVHVRTISPSNGKIIRLVDVESVEIAKHWLSNSYYVEITTRKGNTHSVLEHVPEIVARAKQTEVQSEITAAHEEIGAYEAGLNEGEQRGHARGRQAGLKHGRDEGLSQGWQTGCDEGTATERSRIMNRLIEMREDLVLQEAQGNLLPPARRRYVRNGLTLLRDIIRWLAPDV